MIATELRTYRCQKTLCHTQHLHSVFNLTIYTEVCNVLFICFVNAHRQITRNKNFKNSKKKEKSRGNLTSTKDTRNAMQGMMRAAATLLSKLRQ